MAEIYLPQWNMNLLREQLAAPTGVPMPPTTATESYAMPPLTWQETFTPKPDGAAYSAAELLQFHDADFIRVAYRVILRRAPDAEGAAGFLAALREGRINRLDVLARLRFSSEGVRHNVTIHGLRVPAVLRRAYRVPLVGPVLRWTVAAARLPRLVRHVAQMEAHWAAQQESLTRYINRLNAEHAKHLQQQSAQTHEVAAQMAEVRHENHATPAHEVNLALRQMSQAWHDALARLSATQHEHLAQQQQQHREQAAILEQLKDLSDYTSSLEQHLKKAQTMFETQRQNWQADRRVMAEELAQQRTALASNATRLRDAARLQQMLAQNLARQVVAQDLDRERNHSQMQDLAQEAKQNKQAWEQRLTQTAQLWAQGLEQTQQDLRQRLAHNNQSLTQQLDRTAADWAARWEQLTALESPERVTDFYVALEDGLRGSREMISQRLRVYLPFLAENGLGTTENPVLDVGCGRGEWLELLRQEQFTAQGVDANETQVEYCQALGLNVVAADALEYLRGLPAESYGVVTCFHVVEHLTLDKLLALLHEMHRVLQPGGLVLCETPNPRNVLVGTCNFYYDPTHRNPLPSPVLQIMLAHQGFERVQILDLNPSDAQPVAGDDDLTHRFNEYFYGPMDYAALGWKRVSSQ